MAKGAKPSVPVQKGPIEVGLRTMKTMKYDENVAEKRAQQALTRSGQTCTFNSPKQ